MSPESRCQQCGAEFSSGSKKLLISVERKHYDNSITFMNIGVDARKRARILSHKCHSFTLFNGRETVGHREYANGRLTEEMY